MTYKANIPAEIRAKFVDLACKLSPENLHCDGEISRAQAERKCRQLTSEWKALELQIGRKVGEGEVWSDEFRKELDEHNPFR